MYDHPAFDQFNIFWQMVREMRFEPGTQHRLPDPITTVTLRQALKEISFHLYFKLYTRLTQEEIQGENRPYRAARILTYKLEALRHSVFYFRECRKDKERFNLVVGTSLAYTRSKV